MYKKGLKSNGKGLGHIFFFAFGLDDLLYCFALNEQTMLSLLTSLPWGPCWYSLSQ